MVGFVAGIIGLLELCLSTKAFSGRYQSVSKITSDRCCYRSEVIILRKRSSSKDAYEEEEHFFNKPFVPLDPYFSKERSSVTRNKEDEGDGFHEDEDDLDDEEFTGKNPVLEYGRQLYESIFFYGLRGNTEDENWRAAERDDQIVKTSEFKRFRRSILDNIIFTKTELLALYKTSVKAKRREKNIPDEDYMFSDIAEGRKMLGKRGTARKLGAANKQAIIEPIDTAAEDVAVIIARLKEKQQRLQETIALIEGELKVIEVSLAALEPEEAGEREYLHRDKKVLTEKLKAKKIDLVNILAKVTDLQT